MKYAFTYDESIGHLCIHYNDSYILHIFDMEGRDVYKDRSIAPFLFVRLEENLFPIQVCTRVSTYEKEALIKEHWRQS